VKVVEPKIVTFQQEGGLKLNASKTELIWFDRNAKRSDETLDMNLDIDAN